MLFMIIYDYSSLKDWWNYSYDLKKDSVKKKSSIKVFEEPIPKQMPPEYKEFYYELVDEFGYTIDELEYLRESYGDKVIYEVYINEAQPFYQNTEDGMTVTNIAEK